MENQDNKRIRITAYITPETLKMCDAGEKLAGCMSRSDFVERAISFYSGYLATNTYTNFFASAIAETIEGTIQSTENRIAKLLFKIAVEMAKLEQMLASINDMDEETLQRLHIRCVNEVKKINGIIKMEDAVKYQRNDE